MLGTFEPEGERVRYGLTTNIETYNPVHVAFHEYGAIARDLRRTARAARPHRLRARAPRLEPGTRERGGELTRWHRGPLVRFARSEST